MDEITFVMLLIILLVLGVLSWLLWTSRGQNQKASVDPVIVQQAVQQAMISSTPILKDAVTSSIAQGTPLFKGAFTASLQDLRFQEEMGIIKSAAAEIQSTSASVKAIFENKGARASFAEYQLDGLLRDAFPANKFGIRENLGDLGTPDAHIKTSEGIVCIDAKFPLENYRRIFEALTDVDRKRIAADFRRDVDKHIEKVSLYVRPDRNTAPVAYIFIPSEAVFHYIADNEPGLLQEAVRRNVIVTSPSTLLACLSLIRIAIRAQEITNLSSRIESDLRGLDQNFTSFQELWNLVKKHIHNADVKSDEADRSFTRLKDRFEGIAKMKLTAPDDGEDKSSQK